MNKDIVRNFAIIFSIVFVLVTFIVSLVHFSSHQTFTPTEADIDTGYSVKNIDVKATLMPDGSAYINEIVEVYFNEPRHGIIRTLPLKSNAKFVHKGKNYDMPYILSYSEIEVANYEKQVIKENDNLFIKIGDQDRTQVAHRHYDYNIKYKVNFGNDRLDFMDMFYYNFIGSGWNTPIENYSVRVKFPTNIREFYENNTDYGAFVYYNDGKEQVKKPVLNAEGNSLLYYSTEGIDAFSPATIMVKLADGYFVFEKNYTNSIISLVLLFVGLIVILVLFFVTRSKYKVIPVVELKCPKGINSAEAGYLIDSKVDNQDITSLIVYWADKGYLSIKQQGKEMILTKKKDADDLMQEYEKNLFNDIFRNCDTVNLSKLDYKLSESAHTAKICIEDKNRKKNFKLSALFSIWPLVCIPFLLLGIVSVLNIMVDFSAIFVFCVVLYLLICGISFLICFTKIFQFYLGKKYKIFLIIEFLVLFGLLITFNILLFDKYLDTFMTKIIASVMVLLGCLFVVLQRFRTKNGAVITGRLVGLRKYIEVAEKKKLEMLVSQNPAVFYDILPFAYVLGVSKVWCEKFANIKMEQPSWYLYDGADLFTTMIFWSSLNNGFGNLNNAMFTNVAKNIINSSDSNGGFGGGFSGGGLGGGGGSSW